MTDSRNLALSLVALGFPVFKVRVDEKTGEKTPLHEHGHLDATRDPGLVDDWFSEAPTARVGVPVGPAGLVVLDLDRKNGKDGFRSLDEAWLDVPETFGYDTPSGGRHLVYRAPEGVPLAPSTNYRGMRGVDTRGGSSWVLWNGPAPASIDEISYAPEWLCDPVKVRSAEAFEGDLADWYENLVEGDPNSIVQKAIDRIDEDMGHADMIAAQHHAIRLGAEGHPGVPDLISALENAWLSRPAENHTTPEGNWEYKFAEGLASGVDKAGGTISVLRDAPPYSLDLVPNSVPDGFVVGSPGDREAFSRLVNALVKNLDDDLIAFSILWNSPVTKDMAREWGAEFTFRRLVDAREKPEPERENPALEAKQEADRHRESLNVTSGLLTDEERSQLKPTFVDKYLYAAKEAKGFNSPTYEIPLAWTALSMAVGRNVVIPLNGALGVNLWFNVLGYSGTGKTKSYEFATQVLDHLFSGQESYYNVGADSSPEGLHEALLNRDKLSSVMLEDEAAGFYSNLIVKDWMGSLTHNTSRYYGGEVPPSNKVRLKELKGKRAETSFNMCTISTPNKTVRLLSDEMFATGFLARMSFTWGEKPKDNRHRYVSARANLSENGTPKQALELASELYELKQETTREEGERTIVWATPKAQARMDAAYEYMDTQAQLDSKYENVLEPSVSRLRETMWKCAALLALYRGVDEIDMEDVLGALSYVEVWYDTLYRVSNAITGAFQRDCDDIVEYIEEQGGSSSRERVMTRFVGMITRNKKELEDRIDYLLDSGRINRKSEGNRVRYELNGA